jgi:hypothetical protein
MTFFYLFFEFDISERGEKLGIYLSMPVIMCAGDISSQGWQPFCTTQVLRGGLDR